MLVEVANTSSKALLLLLLSGFAAQHACSAVSVLSRDYTGGAHRFDMQHWLDRAKAELKQQGESASSDECSANYGSVYLERWRKLSGFYCKSNSGGSSSSGIFGRWGVRKGGGHYPGAAAAAAAAAANVGSSPASWVQCFAQPVVKLTGCVASNMLLNSTDFMGAKQDGMLPNSTAIKRDGMPDARPGSVQFGCKVVPNSRTFLRGRLHEEGMKRWLIMAQLSSNAAPADAAAAMLHRPQQAMANAAFLDAASGRLMQDAAAVIAPGAAAVAGAAAAVPPAAPPAAMAACAPGSPLLVKHPVLAIMRLDEANNYHNLEFVVTLFAALAAMQQSLPPSGPAGAAATDQDWEVVIADRLPAGPFVDIWRRLSAPRPLRFLEQQPYLDGTCLARAVLAPFVAHEQSTLIHATGAADTTQCRSLIVHAAALWLRSLFAELIPGGQRAKASGKLRHRRPHRKRRRRLLQVPSHFDQPVPDPPQQHVSASLGQIQQILQQQHQREQQQEQQQQQVGSHGHQAPMVLWLSRARYEKLLHDKGTLTDWQRLRMVPNEGEAIAAMQQAVAVWNAQACDVQASTGSIGSDSATPCNASRILFQFKVCHVHVVTALVKRTQAVSMHHCMCWRRMHEQSQYQGKWCCHCHLAAKWAFTQHGLLARV